MRKHFEGGKRPLYNLLLQRRDEFKLDVLTSLIIGKSQKGPHFETFDIYKHHKALNTKLTKNRNICHSFSRTLHSITGCALILDYIINGIVSVQNPSIEYCIVRNSFQTANFRPCKGGVRFTSCITI